MKIEGKCNSKLVSNRIGPLTWFDRPSAKPGSLLGDMHDIHGDADHEPYKSKYRVLVVCFNRRDFDALILAEADPQPDGRDAYERIGYMKISKERWVVETEAHMSPSTSADGKKSQTEIETDDFYQFMLDHYLDRSVIRLV